MAHEPVELSTSEINIISEVFSKELTGVSRERAFANLMACKYAIERNIGGAFVECGVWRGGNAIIAAALFRLYGRSREVILFDTFNGMVAPTDEDKEIATGAYARTEFDRFQGTDHNAWCYASLDDVKQNFANFGLLDDNIKFVRGDVLETLSQECNLPECISVLRLDTDWYESTKKELEILYPRLSMGGVLLIDDYGHWSGSKRATDEYFAACRNRPFLQYTDYTGRAAVKF